MKERSLIKNKERIIELSREPNKRLGRLNAEKGLSLSSSCQEIGDTTSFSWLIHIYWESCLSII